MRETSHLNIAGVEALLRQRATLPVGHPDRAVLRNRGVEAGLPLERRLAGRYQGRGEPFEDLYQVAALALVRAVDGYDLDRRTAFTSYAVPTIIGALKRHFRDTTWWVRVPRRIQELVVSLGPATADLTQRLGRPPTPTELAEWFAAADEDVLTALNCWHLRYPTSLDAPIVRDGETQRPVGDGIGVVDAGFDAVNDRYVVRSLLADLPDRERRILIMRFFDGLTQSQIATNLGLSQMHISRLLARTLTDLRTGMLAKEPSPEKRRTGGSTEPPLRSGIMAPADSPQVTTSVNVDVRRSDNRRSVVLTAGRHSPPDPGAAHHQRGQDA